MYVCMYVCCSILYVLFIKCAYSMNRCYTCFLLLAFLLVSLNIYIISNHRIHNFNEIIRVVDAVKKPLYNDRCRVHNLTHYQCLPNVFLIGASKAGTTSLMNYLTQHPNVSFVRRTIEQLDKHKEVHRFDRDTYGAAIEAIDLGFEWALSPLVTDVSSPVIHYTPSYLYAPTVPYELSKFYPNPNTLKFIVMLRKPAERALSSYWFHQSHLFNVQDGGSLYEFKMLMMEEMRARKEYERCTSSTTDVTNSIYSLIIDVFDTLRYVLSTVIYSLLFAVKKQDIQDKHTDKTSSRSSQIKSMNYKKIKECFGSSLRSPLLGHRHVDKGIYYDQLLRWFDNFPRDNFHIIVLDEWALDPLLHYRLLLDFIGAKHDDNRFNISSSIDFNDMMLYKPNLLSIMSSSGSGSGSSSNNYTAILAMMEKYYMKYNTQLQKVINRKLYW